MYIILDGEYVQKWNKKIMFGSTSRFDEIPVHTWANLLRLYKLCFSHYFKIFGSKTFYNFKVGFLVNCQSNFDGSFYWQQVNLSVTNTIIAI